MVPASTPRGSSQHPEGPLSPKRVMSVPFLKANEARFLVRAKRMRTVLVSSTPAPVPVKTMAPLSRLVPSKHAVMRTPITQLTAAQLHAILRELATKAAEYIVRPKRGSKRRIDEPLPESEPVPSGLVIYDAEKSRANASRKGPYTAMAEVVASLLISKPKTSLSTMCIEQQYLLLRASFSTTGPFGARASMLDQLLNDASLLATELFSELVAGWKRGIEPVTDIHRVLYKAADGITEADFWNWNPTKLSYRALSVLNGAHVLSYRADFVWDFYTRSKSGSAQERKANPLSNHPFIKAKLEEILRPRDDVARRPSLQLSSGDKKRRHPCVGPLDVEDYHLHKADIEHVYKTSADAAAAAARLAQLFPLIPIDSILRQHHFEIRYVQLCDRVISAFFEYQRELFGSDVASMHGIFCLTTMQNNKGDRFEDVNCPAGWYIRMLGRFMTFDEPELKTKNYKPFTEFLEFDSVERRQPVSRSIEQVFLQMSGRLSGWVQSEFLKNLTTFFLTRARAFEHSELLPVMKRDDRLSWLSISRNDCDSFDDLIKTRKIERADNTPMECLTSWRTPGSLTEEANLVNDAVTLAIVVVGREAACRDFPDALHAAGIALQTTPSDDAANECGPVRVGSLVLVDTEFLPDMHAIKPRGRTAVSRLERLESTEDLMSNWLSLRQRCDKKTLLMRIQGVIDQLRTTLKHADHAVRLTRLVANEYHSVRQVGFTARARILNMSDDIELSADERIQKDMSKSEEEQSCLETALSTVFATMKFDPFCTFKQSLATLVGKPPCWHWETSTDFGDKTTVPNSQHAAFVRALEALLSEYADYIATCRDSTTMVDFVSPIDAYVQMLLSPKTVINDDERDWVGFAESIGRVRASKQVLDCIGIRIHKMQSIPGEFVDKLCEVTHHAFHIALEWAGVFSANSVRLRANQMPRMGLAIVYILKVLSVAVAHEAIRFGADCTRPVLFRVGTDRVDIADIADIVKFATHSTTNWKCLCAIAALTKLLLCYNRELIFDAYEINGRSIEDGIASVSFCKEKFMVVHRDALNAHRIDLHAYRSSVVADSAAYPPNSDWTFHDLHWTSPNAFEILLTWLPDVAHDTVGFFPLTGVRDRPNKTNGFLNVSETLHYSCTATTPQHWDSFFTHRSASTHGRLPTPPGVAAGGDTQMQEK